MSKLNIPEGSKDIIWRMLFGGVSAKKTGNSGDDAPGRGGRRRRGATPQIPRATRGAPVLSGVKAANGPTPPQATVI